MSLTQYLWAHVQFLFLATTALLGATAGSLFLRFWIWPRPCWAKWRLDPRSPQPAMPAKEATLTFFNLMIYMYPFLLTAAVEYQTGYTVRYASISEKGWPYFFLTMAIFLFVIDADFYWTHRFLHGYLKGVHAVHHQFVNPTPWCGFAFHFVESLLLALPYVPLLLLLPWHPAAVALVQITAMTWNAFLHLGFDPFSESFKRRRPVCWLLTARDHCGHHHNPKSNFGLYFTFWDDIFGTRFGKHA